MSRARSRPKPLTSWPAPLPGQKQQEPPLFFASRAEAGAHGSMGPGLRREDENDVLRLPEPSEREQQVERSRWWSRLRGPVGSLVLHLLPLLLLIDWPISPPAETA